MSFLFWAWLRREAGFFAESDFGKLFGFGNIVNSVWIILFAFMGMYGPSYTKSRVDEFISVFKAVTGGVILLFLMTFEGARDLETPPRMSRMFILNYWVILLFFVTAGRLLYRTIHKAILAQGYGHLRTVIVGWGKRSWELAEQIQKFPALGYQIVGFVGEKKELGTEKQNNFELLGSVDEIEDVLKKAKAQEVILAVKGNARKKIVEVMDRCNGYPVNFKIVPDLYDIVVGQARTNQIYGFPLIAIEPSVMQPWEQRFKRLVDFVFALSVLIIFSPIWLLVALAIKLDSPGPALYKQDRVGLGGVDFTIYKFRSMVQDAESQSGPKWAQKEDPRITRLGKWIRKLRIDEVPQFINVVKGEMSLIGPRPERRYFVEKFKKEIPFYARRLRVRPGITGWAQIKSGYDQSFDNVRTKLQYDLFYLENMSLRMDLKVMINTVYVMLRGRGQ